MKRYIKPMPNGGLDFRNNDWLDCLQEEQYNALIALIKGIGGTGNYILSGCAVTYNAGPQTVTITAGYVFLNGDIHKFNGVVSFPCNAAEPRVYMLEDTPSFLARIFKNLVSTNAVKETKLKVQIANPGATPNILINDTTTATVLSVLNTYIQNTINTTINNGVDAGDVVATAVNDCLAIPAETDLDVIVQAIRAMLCQHETDISNLQTDVTALQALFVAWSVFDIQVGDIVWVEQGGSPAMTTATITSKDYRYLVVGKMCWITVDVAITNNVPVLGTANETYVVRVALPGGVTPKAGKKSITKVPFRKWFGGGNPNTGPDFGDRYVVNGGTTYVEITAPGINGDAQASGVADTISFQMFFELN